MAGEGLAQLRTELGAEPAASLVASITDEDLAKLARLAHDAKRAQAAALAQAGEQALSHLPRLLRITVERVLR
jgi:pyruvate dehydrogenase complex dehydrogenase (E1) component